MSKDRVNLDKDDSERDEILLRYFSKELTSEERSEVDAWRNVSPENQHIFDEAAIFAKDLKALAYYTDVSAVDADQSWQIFSKKNNVRPVQNTTSGSYLKYAASIVIAIAAALGGYFYLSQPKEVLMASADQVQNRLLPEGSKVDLNKGATIRYEEPFQNNERRVTLSGDAYFEVKHMPHKPFVVEVGEVEVRVLGTKFFINQTAEEVGVQVTEGKVLVSYKDSHKILSQGETIYVDVDSREMKEKSDPFGMDSFWKTRKLVFYETSLDEVMKVVSASYDKAITLDGSTSGCELTVTFDNVDFDNVMEVIAATLNYEVSEKQDTYILKGNGCQ